MTIISWLIANANGISMIAILPTLMNSPMVSLEWSSISTSSFCVAGAVICDGWKKSIVILAGRRALFLRAWNDLVSFVFEGVLLGCGGAY